jgi:hypothetical protein
MLCKLCQMWPDLKYLASLWLCRHKQCNWKFDEEILRNGKVIANVQFSCQNPSTKRGIKSDFDLKIWNQHKCVFITINFESLVKKYWDMAKLWPKLSFHALSNYKKGHNSTKCNFNIKNLTLSWPCCHK